MFPEKKLLNPKYKQNIKRFMGRMGQIWEVGKQLEFAYLYGRWVSLYLLPGLTDHRPGNRKQVRNYKALPLFNYRISTILLQLLYASFLFETHSRF